MCHVTQQYDSSVLSMLSRASYVRRCSGTALSRVQALISSNDAAGLSKTLCSMRSDSVTESEWNQISESVVSFIEKAGEGRASLVPSIIISSASLRYSLKELEKERLATSAVKLFDALSVFDKIVFTIGCSQAGVRTPEVVDFVNRFLNDSRTEFSGTHETFLPSLLLAVATLGVVNPTSWNQLLARTNIEALTPHDLVNVTLAVVTSRTFPISTIEQIIDTAAATGAARFSFNDAISFTHSMATLEVFRTDLFRSMLLRISECPSLDSDAQKLVKQCILSLFIDDKARDIATAISPTVLARLDKLVDWSVPEPQRHHGLVAGEIQQLTSAADMQEGDNDESVGKMKPLPVLPLSEWTRDLAVSVAMDRFYETDVPIDGRKVFVHIDDETYPDLDEGPIDPYLQLKHSQISRCGYKIVWVREAEWLDSSWEDKKDFITDQLR